MNICNEQPVLQTAHNYWSSFSSVNPLLNYDLTLSYDTLRMERYVRLQCTEQLFGSTVFADLFPGHYAIPM